ADRPTADSNPTPNYPTGQPTQVTDDDWPAGSSYPPVNSLDDVDYYLFDNSNFYGASLPATSCSFGSLDLIDASTAEIQTYLDGLVYCYMDVWEDAVTGAGYDLPVPTITVYDAPITTACGVLDMGNAWFCHADGQMYYATDLVWVFPDLAREDYIAEAVLAHEFGHGVQGYTGIYEAESYSAYLADSTEDELEWNRRLELQADCFAGLFFRSVADSAQLNEGDTANLTVLFELLADPYPGGDHGVASSRVDWFNTGLDSTQPLVCNTMTASSRDVE
ncbi:MAG: neutral zinc metallopeptidase, partial [Bifidobacteriaceae bacterium]|nr:neutral zinc metallopeptidase [Bifidobacteriaceae bacterium]